MVPQVGLVVGKIGPTAAGRKGGFEQRDMAVRLAVGVGQQVVERWSSWKVTICAANCSVWVCHPASLRSHPGQSARPAPVPALTSRVA